MPDLVLLRAALSAVAPRRPAPVEPVRLQRRGVRAEPGRVTAYAQVCGARGVDPLPFLYPHVLAFGLTMRLMTRRDFPFPAPGLVHVRDVVTQHRSIRLGEPLDVTVTATAPAPHRRGRVVDISTDIRVGATPVWSERSTYLRRERQRPRATPQRLPADAAGEPAAWTEIDRWPADAATGRRYACVSGDHNPIHLSALTARPFGFRRAIAHGMWTAARALSSLPPEPPGAATMTIDFVSPVSLPSTLSLVADPQGERFEVRSGSGRVHVRGSLTAQDDVVVQDAPST